VKIHKLWAENVRGISKRLTVELEPTGLNLVIAPNEMGKTTMAEVLNFLFQSKSGSEAQVILDLKPYGKDVGPLMGAMIEVDGQTYKIEKQWLKDKKTEVELLSPEAKKLSGPAADKVIDEIFTQYLDETIWKMIQVAQANFTDLLVEEYKDEQRDMLRYYLSRAVADDDDASDESLAEKAEEEFLDWWQPSKKKLTAAKGTSGGLIDEKTKALNTLRATVAGLETNIADAASVKAEMIVNRESREVLQKRKQAQDANRDLLAAQRELKTRTDAQAAVDKHLAANPAIKNFSQDLFDAINDDRALHAQYNALSSIKLMGLGAVDLEINGTSLALKKGESRDQKLESPLNITIPNLLSIEYDVGTASAAGLEEGAKRYAENLKQLGCDDFPAAQTLSRNYNELQRLIGSLDALLNVFSLETLQAAVTKNETIRASLPNWDADIVAAPVTAADLEEVAQQVGQKEGRSEEISRFGWHTTLLETREKIADHEKRLLVLNKKAQAARMLHEVLNEHKNSAEKDYSIHFAKYINDLAKSFYGEEVHFKVSDSFEILSRRMGSTEVAIKDLSTGAKEQLAILIRLALTQIVHVGEPFPVILDDEFAHSDPDRIAMMNNIFSDFAEEQQFIMLTCHPDKFAGYKPAKTIDLAALRGA
jgi:uncharacterized protein YhaN